MADVDNYCVIENTDYEVLTDQGFKDFKGLIVGENINKINLRFNNGIELNCTPKHKIILKNNAIVYACNLNVGDVVYNDYIVEKVNMYSSSDKVYELLEVADTHKYFANGILSHQCLIIDEMAFIEPESILQDFWRSVFPTISRSKKSKVLIASTPNGTGNLFHTLFDGAEKKENEFVYERVLWSAIPGRDEEWKQKQIRALGSTESFLQEYETVFLTTGDSSLDEELFYKLSQNCKPAPIILDEGHYKIWEEPDASRIYVAGVDIAEGVGMDASVIQIMDITDIAQIKQVAVYHNNTIAPLEFTNKLYSILRNWGSPIALIERNNCGAQVVDRLVFDMGYEKIVSYGAKVAGRNRPQMGMIAHTNTKYKGILNMRYFLNELKCVEFYDIDTLKELKDFVRHPNGTWKARGVAHDDRVMSLMYALYILERELTERFFEILELDDRGKPKNLSPMDFGVSLFEKPTSIYLDNEITSIGGSTTNPIVFGMTDDEEIDDLFDLQSNGWTLL